MSGPEHYRAAENWLREAEDGWGAGMIPEAVAALAAIAQGHATLAAAAAAVEQTGARGPGDITIAWSDIVWPHQGGVA